MQDNKQAVYREVQRFRQKWLWILLLLLVALSWGGYLYQALTGKPFGNKPASNEELLVIGIIFGLLLPLLFANMKLVTEVESKGVTVFFVPFRRRFIPFEQIAQAEERTYQPFWEYGGWGIKWSPVNGWAYNVSGNQGVFLLMKDGKKLLIGSRDAHSLFLAISNGMKQNIQ